MKLPRLRENRRKFNCKIFNHCRKRIGGNFSDTGIDIATALKEKAIILFILNPLIYPEISPAFGRLVLIDSKKAISQRFQNDNRTFFLFDEINVYASKTLIDLVNKSRSANVTCVLATY